MTLTIEDLEKLQQKLQDEEQNFQIELQEENILVMSPSDIESSKIGAQLIFLFLLWVKCLGLTKSRAVAMITSTIFELVEEN
ncbi:Uma2 family endonuclease [Fortiea contorta]|uniref:Uma2 family endonuclease n=1 Tax=Fortiea contorta TaxID=1892405 RepID=UPI000346AA42|nr:Uma2 family endonuclease [Fortiea contorta]